MNLPRVLMRLGNLCFVLVWIPFAALMINMVLYGGKSRYTSIEEIMEVSFFQLGFWLILMIIFAVGAALFFISGVIAGKLAYKQIVKNGQDAEAKILALKDTGTRINDNPLVNISLEVQPPNLPSFFTETRTTVSILELPLFQPGKIVRVKYIPGTEKVAIVGAKLG